MSDLRETLERESERFVFLPRGLERLHRRRRRRQRNRRLGVGVLTLTLAAGGTLFAVRAFQRVRPAPRPAAQPRVVEIASIGVRPAAMAVTQEGVWVVSSQDRTVRRLHPVSGEVVDEIPLPDGLGPPGGVAAWRGSIWIQTGFASGPPEVSPAVVRIDPTGPVRTTFPLDRGENVGVTFGEGAVWSLGRGREEAAPPLSGTIARIEARTASATLSTQVGVSPTDLAVREGAVWVVHAASRSVVRIDTETVTITDEIPVPGVPSQITAGGTGVWVLDTGSGILFRIDPGRTRITGSVKVGPGAVAVAADRDGVWAARSDGTILRLQG